MSDWLIIRIPFDAPNKAEILELLADVPLDWQKYLDKVAKTTKKPGRYLAADILYKVGEAFFPSKDQRKYHQTEKESND